MEISKPLERRIKRNFRDQKTIGRQTEKAIEKSCGEYHDWCDEQKQLKNKPLTILAEGDSWFKYVVGKAIIYQLEKLLDLPIQNLASPGDEATQMLAPKQLERLSKLLKRGPSKGWKYDLMLFSGGGNDLAGRDRFHNWINQYQSGMSPKQLINHTTLKAKLTLIIDSYEQLIAIRDKNSPKTHLFFHAYDLAIPNGKGVCWLGPWMEPGLKFRKVPVSKRREVVQLLLLEFDKALDKLSKKYDRITIIKSQGTLNDTEWANELHPTNRGFRKIAKVFENEITKQFPRP